MHAEWWVNEFCDSFPIVVYFLLSELNFERFNSGVAVSTLGWKTVHQASVPLPSPDAIETFDTFVQPLFDKIDVLKAGIENTSKAHDLPLPKLILGPLDASGIRLPEKALA